MNVSNHHAIQLAKQINAGESARQVAEPAFIDAMIHADWSRVAALENSLTRVTDRTLVRNLGALAGRGVLLQRADDNVLARLIPDGHDIGVAWIVTATFLRSDGDHDQARAIANDFMATFDRSSTPDIEWGVVPLVTSHLGFGPVTRADTTRRAFSGDRKAIDELHKLTEQLSARVRANNRGKLHSPEVFFLWGCHVTGVDDAVALLDPTIYCPGFNLEKWAPAVTQALAQSAERVGGETHVHPQLLPADQAYDFGVWMTREQTIRDIIAESFSNEPQRIAARVSVLTPHVAPYMDQLLLGMWTTYGVLRYTFGFPRSEQAPEDDAKRVATMLRQCGVTSVELVNPSSAKGANDVAGWAVDAEGQWIKTLNGRVGTATSLIQAAAWSKPNFEDGHATDAANLPCPLFVKRIGAASILEDHYQAHVAAAVKEALAKPGDPEDLIVECLRSFAAQDCPIDALLEHDHALMLPPREESLAYQFALAGGVLADVTGPLQQILAATDIGNDCPTQFIRPAFDLLYLRLQAAMEGSDHEPDHLDGILIQRICGSDRVDLLLDCFLNYGPGNAYDAYPAAVASYRFSYDDTSATIENLMAQLPADEGLGESVLRTTAGVLLYMNSKEARSMNCEARSEAERSLGLKNRKKRTRSDYAAVERAYDRIVIGPDHLSHQLASINNDGRKELRTHYRRGHVRINQRYGPGLSLTRPIFIPPVLVNAKKLAAGDASPSPSNYVVR